MWLHGLLIVLCTCVALPAVCAEINRNDKPGTGHNFRLSGSFDAPGRKIKKLRTKKSPEAELYSENSAAVVKVRIDT